MDTKLVSAWYGNSSSASLLCDQFGNLADDGEYLERLIKPQTYAGLMVVAMG